MEVAVPMDGNFLAEVAVVAEAPGNREMEMRVPLVGGSGQHLWKVLQKYGLNRTNCYITNVVKRQLQFGGDSADEKLGVPGHELDHWAGLLRWELSRLPNLRYILILGDMALRALTPYHGITSWRGSVIEVELLPNTQPIKTVVTFNPAFVLREPKNEIVFAFDCAKLAKVMAGNWKPYIIKPIINPSFSDAMDWLGEMSKTDKPVSVDIETLAEETACIGLTNDDHTGMCINFRSHSGHHYSPEEECRIRLRLQELFNNPAVRLIMQNAGFDCGWLAYKDRIMIRSVWLDTLLAHHTLYSQLPHSLAFLTAQYTTHPYYKDEKDEWKEGGDINRYWEYNVKDICLTRHIAGRVEEELRAAKMDKFFFEHVMRLQPHLVRMTAGGIKADQDLKDHIAVELTKQVADLREKFYAQVQAATGEPELIVNPNSSAALKVLFFGKLRLTGRGTATDEANRKRIKDNPRTPPAARELITTLDKFKEESKFLSTYAEAKIDPDGRFRCDYKQYGTQSSPGRLSSTKTLWGSGMNLQNQPKRSQPMFVADPGYGFFYFDLSQAEARVVAYEANIAKWKEQFERARIDGSYDAHRALASDMWHIPYDEVPKEDEVDGKKTLRFIAKRCRHGLNYRMQADRLAETTGLPLHEARAAFATYHAVNPELRKWWEELEREIRQTKTLYNALGRRLIILERITDEALESIVAFKPQSLIGDKVCQVMYQSEDDDEWPCDARFVLNIHDALIGIAPLSKVMTCLKIAKRYAESPIMIKGEPLIIPADCKVSVPTRWQLNAETGQVEYVPDEHGAHRWYGMKKATVEV